LKIEEIRGLKEAELGRKAEELRRERFQLRVQQTTGQVEKHTSPPGRNRASQE